MRNILEDKGNTAKKTDSEAQTENIKKLIPKTQIFNNTFL